jgi:phosphotransferase system HPr (HPr) family protein
MTQLTVQLLNEDGLHARPAGLLAKAASQFQSKIELKAKGMQKNAKSIMSIMALGLEKGDEIEIFADGADESSAIETLKKLFTDKFETAVESAGA